MKKRFRKSQKEDSSQLQRCITSQRRLNFYPVQLDLIQSLSEVERWVKKTMMMLSNDKTSKLREQRKRRGRGKTRRKRNRV